MVLEYYFQEMFTFREMSTIKLLCDQKKRDTQHFHFVVNYPSAFFQGRDSYFITQPELIVACHKKVKLYDIKAVH